MLLSLLAAAVDVTVRVFLLSLRERVRLTGENKRGRGRRTIVKKNK